MPRADLPTRALGDASLETDGSLVVTRRSSSTVAMVTSCGLAACSPVGPAPPPDRFPAYCCTASAGVLGPYPNGSVREGEACFGTDPTGRRHAGRACFNDTVPPVTPGGLPSHCCTAAGALGPYPNAAIREGGACLGTDSAGRRLTGTACFADGGTIAPPPPERSEAGTPPVSDFGDPYRPVIGGVRVYCTNFYTRGRVAFVANPGLNDVGRALPGMPPTIELNPTYLAQLPPTMQLFWYGHECAHHVLGPANSESNADCWSIRTGRDQALFTRADVLEMQGYIARTPGSPWGHLPGPARAQLLLACFDGP